MGSALGEPEHSAQQDLHGLHEGPASGFVRQDQGRVVRQPERRMALALEPRLEFRVLPDAQRSHGVHGGCEARVSSLPQFYRIVTLVNDSSWQPIAGPRPERAWTVFDLADAGARGLVHK